MMKKKKIIKVLLFQVLTINNKTRRRSRIIKKIIKFNCKQPTMTNQDKMKKNILNKIVQKNLNIQFHNYKFNNLLN